MLKALHHFGVSLRNFHGKGTEIYKVLYELKQGSKKMNQSFGGKREILRESNYPIIALYKAPPSMRASLTKSRSSQTTATIERVPKSRQPQSKKSKTKNSQQNNVR